MKEKMDLSAPLISVIMPAYNAEKYITMAMRSILSQTYTNLELIIADDASTDNTLKIINSFKDSRIKAFHNEHNQGYLKTWNKLIKLSQGDYITFQDADDYSNPERIEKMVLELKNNPSIGICGSNYIKVDQNGNERFKSNFQLNHNEIVNAMPGSYNFIGSGVMITREVYKAIGGYNDFFDRMGGEDHYWIYLITEKFKIKNLSEPLYYYRYNPNSVMGDLTTNSKKLFSSDILTLLIGQRRETGTDDLEGGKPQLLEQKLNELIDPFEKDKALFYCKVAKQRYYEGQKRQSINIMLKAILEAPTRLAYYRDLIYFIKN